MSATALEPRYVRAMFLALFGRPADEDDLAEAEFLMVVRQDDMDETLDAYGREVLRVQERWVRGDHLSDQEREQLADADVLMRVALEHATPEQKEPLLRAAALATMDLWAKAARSETATDRLETLGLRSPLRVIEYFQEHDLSFVAELEQALRGAK